MPMSLRKPKPTAAPTDGLPERLARLRLENGDVLHVTVPGKLDLDRRDVDSLHALLKAHGLGGVLVLLTRPELSLAAVDAAIMRRYGWQRVPSEAKERAA